MTLEQLALTLFFIGIACIACMWWGEKIGGKKW